MILDALARMNALLDGLKPRARRVFLLSRLEGLPYTGIGVRLGVSLSTVAKDMALALRHCYQLLMDDDLLCRPGAGRDEAWRNPAW